MLAEQSVEGNAAASPSERARIGGLTDFGDRLRRLLLGEPLAPGRYTAFISYRRVEPDRPFAVRLHRALEAYVVPRELGKARRLGRFFRDADELAAAGSLSAAIKAALDRSDWLIVVCSPRSKGSPWVTAEIRHFIDTGRGDRILAVLMEGEPEDAFPDALSQVAGASLTSQAGHRDTLAADARPQAGISAREQARSVLLSLAAPMLGVTLDALRRRDRARAVRRLTQVVAVSVALLGIMTGLAVFAELNRREALSRQLQAQVRESLMLANMARQQTAAGDAATGALLALRGLPGEADDRPVVGEVAGALIEALAELREAAVLRNSIRDFTVRADGKAVVTMDPWGRAVLWDVATGVRSQLPHQSGVGVAAFSSDGGLVATGDWDGQVRLWSRSGTLIRSFEPHTNSLELLAFTTDDTALISVSQDGYARRTTLTGEPEDLDFGPGVTSFRSAAFDPVSGTLAGAGEDGAIIVAAGGAPERSLAAAQDGPLPLLQLDRQARRLLALRPGLEVAVFDLQSDRRTPIPAGEKPTAASLSADGETVVVGLSDGALSAWSATTGQLVANLPGHTGEISAITFNPDGTMLATSSDDRTIRLWDTRDWRLLGTLAGHARQVRRVAFIDGGQALLSSALDDSLRTWAVQSPRELMQLNGHTSTISSAAAAVDGQTLATTSVDGTARFWDLASGEGTLLERPYSGPLYGIGNGPVAGQFALNAWDRQLEIWQRQPPQLLGRFNPPHDGVRGLISFDGKFVLENNNGALRIADVKGKSILRSWEAPPTQEGAFHPSQSLLLLASGNELSLLEVPQLQMTATRPIAAEALRVGFDDSGDTAYALQSNGELSVFSSPNLELKFTIPGTTERSEIILMPQCDTVVSTGPSRVEVRRLSSGAVRLAYTTRDETPRLAADASCRRLAMVGDDEVRVVDLTDGTDIATLQSPASALRFAIFIPNSLDLVTADDAGYLYRWRIPATIRDLREAAEAALPRTWSEAEERRFGLR